MLLEGSHITSVSKPGTLHVISLIKLYHGKRMDESWERRTGLSKSKESWLFNVAI